MKKEIAVILYLLLCISILVSCSGYKEQYGAEPVSTKTVFDIKNVGDIITFGTYEQDNKLDAKEPIEWVVLSIEKDRALLVSKYVIDLQPYNTSNENVNWETCSLRKWLNNDFYNEAFDMEEKKNIIKSDIFTSGKSWNDTDVNTQDEVFLLSYSEIKNSDYFQPINDIGISICSKSLLADVTPYAKKQGVKTNIIKENKIADYAIKEEYSDVVGQRTAWWWTRDLSDFSTYCECVGDMGQIVDVELDSDYVGVRPVISVKISAQIIDNSSFLVKDTITLGTYEQDGDVSNGEESIEWDALSIEDDRALLVSHYILDLLPYNDTQEKVTWETCSLRNWMNNEFYNNAFSEEEKGRILEVNLTNPDNVAWAAYKVIGGEDTKDKVFALSFEEVEKYYNFESWHEDSSEGPGVHQVS